VVHLHLHTHFSFGSGVSSPDVLAAAAAERGYRALACTDTNGVYGVLEFQRACDAVGVRPILGAHLVTDDEETVALATDERGWGALCRAISEIHWAGESQGRTGVQAHRRTEERRRSRPAGVRSAARYPEFTGAISIRSGSPRPLPPTALACSSSPATSPSSLES
jgi:DNA polymerase III alpha subunit